LLSGIRIDSITVSKCQHSSNIEKLLVTSKKVNVNFRDIESRKINLGESMYPTLNQRLQRGSYSSPKPPQEDKAKIIFPPSLAVETILIRQGG
jgi:hypothetical protein